MPFKLGKQPAKFDSRTLKMKDYVDAAYVPPAFAQNTWGITQWGMMLNGPDANAPAGVPSDGLGDCFTGGTLIPLIDGRTLTIKELTEQYPHEKFYVYSYDPSTKKLCPGTAYAPRLARKNAPICKVTLDDGSSYKSTREHLFMRLDGSYSQVEVGESFLGLYRWLDTDGYELSRISTWDYGFYTHRLMASFLDRVETPRYVDGIDRGGWVVHHKLTCLRNRFYGNQNIKFAQNPESLKKSLETRRERYENDPEFKAKTKATALKNYANIEKGSGQHARWHKNRGVISPNCDLCQKALVSPNHKIVSIEDAGYADVYDLSVETYQNFALDCGLIAHNCTIAAVAHAIQVWTKGAVTPPNTLILEKYEQWDGYVLGNAATDNGGVELTVLNNWRNNTFGGHVLLGYCQPQPQNFGHIMHSIAEFGGVYIGLQLPNSAITQNQNGQIWDVVANDGGIAGGHAVYCPAYHIKDSEANGATTITAITWGGLQKMTRAFWEKYCEESHCLLGAAWEPKGFNLAKYQADLAAING